MKADSRQTEYLRLNDKYLKEAEQLIAKKDYAQASEKLWGATAEIVKAVAARRGIELGTHRSIAEFVSRLSREHPAWNLIESFSVASALHTNFYEDHMPADHVVKNAEIVKDFVKKVKDLL